MFEMYNSFINMRRTINLRFNGTYTYIISNPMLFYTKLCGNVEYEATRELIDGQLKADFVDALQPAVGTLTEQEIRPAQLTQKVNILKEAMNAELVKWNERGISIKTITINPITLNKEDLEKIQEMEDAATLGSNPQMMAGRTVTATAEAMQTAAGNSAGAMTGFMGMGMVGGTMGGSGGFAAAQSMYAMNQQQQAQNQPQQQTAGWTCSCGQSGNIGKFCQECGKPQPADSNGWTCSCGAVNKGKFCAECGKPKPAGAPQYKCDKCGWEPDDPTNPPKFCPECGDPFDDGDIKG